MFLKKLFIYGIEFLWPRVLFSLFPLGLYLNLTKLLLVNKSTRDLCPENVFYEVRSQEMFGFEVWFGFFV